MFKKKNVSYIIFSIVTKFIADISILVHETFLILQSCDNIHFNIAGYFNYDRDNIVSIYATNSINIPD